MKKMRLWTAILLMSLPIVALNSVLGLVLIRDSINASITAKLNQEWGSIAAIAEKQRFALLNGSSSQLFANVNVVLNQYEILAIHFESTVSQEKSTVFYPNSSPETSLLAERMINSSQCRDPSTGLRYLVGSTCLKSTRAIHFDLQQTEPVLNVTWVSDSAWGPALQIRMRRYLFVVLAINIVTILALLGVGRLLVVPGIRDLQAALEAKTLTGFLETLAGTRSSLITEFASLKNRMTTMGKELEAGEKARLAAATQSIELKQLETKNLLAQQVAHDIRSPLAALEMVQSSTKTLPEDTRVLMRAAIARIRDIANNLVQSRSLSKATNLELQPFSNVATGRGAYGSTTANSDVSLSQATSNQRSIELISVLVDEQVSEKRLQYRSRIGVDIDAIIDRQSYGLFAEVDSSQLKRVLSNLINNSVEALVGDRGRVTIKTTSDDEFVLISIEDTGSGIAPELLPKLGVRGASFGKEAHSEAGAGLGLHHALKTLESWGGGLSIESTLSKGTTVTVRLKRVPTPEWFVPELKLNGVEHIVVLDDDQSIHSIWQGRFESALGAIKNARDGSSQFSTIHHFSTPIEIERFVANLKSDANALYLFDYELLGERETGLDLIDRLALGKDAILVTSRFEETTVRKRCAALGVRLIPKPMAAFVPIVFDS